MPTKCKYQIGDRVYCAVDIPTFAGFIPTYCMGTIIETPLNDDYIGVEWDEDIGGHSLDGLCEDGYGWRFSKDTIEIERSPDMSKDEPFEEDEEMLSFLGSI